MIVCLQKNPQHTRTFAKCLHIYKGEQKFGGCKNVGRGLFLNSQVKLGKYAQKHAKFGTIFVSPHNM